jgi:hypothetical protein
MLDEIADFIVSGKLQDIFLEDPDYQELSEEQKKASLECYHNVPEEYHDLIENLMDAQNCCSGRLIDLAYKQGMIDCAQMLKELKLK